MSGHTYIRVACFCQRMAEWALDSLSVHSILACQSGRQSVSRHINPPASHQPIHGCISVASCMHWCCIYFAVVIVVHRLWNYEKNSAWTSRHFDVRLNWLNAVLAPTATTLIVEWSLLACSSYISGYEACCLCCCCCCLSFFLFYFFSCCNFIRLIKSL